MRIRLKNSIDIWNDEPIPITGFPLLNQGIMMIHPDLKLCTAHHTMKHLADDDTFYKTKQSLCGKEGFWEDTHGLYGGSEHYNLQQELVPYAGVIHSICDKCISIAQGMQGIEITRKKRGIIDVEVKNA